MPYRYYIQTTNTGTQNIREYFEKKGVEIHLKRKERRLSDSFTIPELSDYFTLPGMTVYINIPGEKGIVRSVVEFDGDRGDLKKLEEIAKVIRAVRVEDTFKNEIKF
jgi:hypothetical protein